MVLNNLKNRFISFSVQRAKANKLKLTIFFIAITSGTNLFAGYFSAICTQGTTSVNYECCVSDSGTHCEQGPCLPIITDYAWGVKGNCANLGGNSKPSLVPNCTLSSGYNGPINVNTINCKFN